MKTNIITRFFSLLSIACPLLMSSTYGESLTINDQQEEQLSTDCISIDYKHLKVEDNNVYLDYSFSNVSSDLLSYVGIDIDLTYEDRQFYRGSLEYNHFFKPGASEHTSELIDIYSDYIDLDKVTGVIKPYSVQGFKNVTEYYSSDSENLVVSSVSFDAMRVYTKDYYEFTYYISLNNNYRVNMFITDVELDIDGTKIIYYPTFDYINDSENGNQNHLVFIKVKSNTENIEKYIKGTFSAKVNAVAGKQYFDQRRTSPFAIIALISVGVFTVLPMIAGLIIGIILIIKHAYKKHKNATKYKIK